MKPDGGDAIPAVGRMFSRDENEDLEACRRQIYRSLRRLTQDHGEAEDLAQETLLRCWRKRHLFEGRGSFAGFVHRTAFRLWLNHRKKELRRERLALAAWSSSPAPVAAPAVEVVCSDSLERFLDLLREALEELSTEQREAFVAFRLEGLTCAEIAERQSEPVKTIETRVRRATLALAERLKGHRHLLTTRP